MYQQARYLGHIVIVFRHNVRRHTHPTECSVRTTKVRGWKIVDRAVCINKETVSTAMMMTMLVITSEMCQLLLLLVVVMVVIHAVYMMKVEHAQRGT